MIKGKLLYDRYFIDDEFGLIHDLSPMARGAGDQSVLNDRVDSECHRLELLNKANTTYLPTLFLLQSQIDALGDHWLNIIAPKTYLMYFAPGKYPSEINIQYWSAYGNDVFWYVAEDVVFSKYDINGLGDRYPRVKESEIVVPGETPTTPPSGEVVPANIVFPDYDITLFGVKVGSVTKKSS